MRKVLVSNVASLDNFFEGPSNEVDWFVVDEDFFAYAREMLNAVGTILFGRKTYEHMASHWPSARSDPIADKMNNLPKIVFSKTLQKMEWNNSELLKGDPAQEVSKLKKQPGPDMVVLASSTIATTLLQAGLIDEYRVIISPILIGRGRPLFEGITTRLTLKLMATRTFASGVVMLSYAAA